MFDSDKPGFLTNSVFYPLYFSKESVCVISH